MDNKFIGLMVGLTVGVLMVSGFLWPIVADATATEKTFENTGYYNMTYSEVDNLTLTWEYTNPNVIVVNGEPVTMSVETFPGPLNIICGDNWFLRWTGPGVQFYSSANGSIVAGDASVPSLTITANNGVATVTNTATPAATQTVNYTFMYVVDPKGEYVMKNSNDPVYINGDSEIYAIGRSSTTGIVIKLKITGNVDDGFTAEEVGDSGVSATVGTPTATYETVSGYNDLYTLSKIEVPVEYTNAGSTVNFTPTYTYFIVPAEVTAEKAQHLDTMQIAMIGVIGTLGAIVLIAAAAGSIRRLD